jgi:bifunctional pyridoxal-dependent enzyme with beta-cystathionase and maltose regulon repressor activities
MVDISKFPFPDDWAFAMALVEQCGVACVPGSSFFARPEDGKRFVRFVFAKSDETLDRAIENLSGLDALREKDASTTAGRSSGRRAKRRAHERSRLKGLPKR